MSGQGSSSSPLVRLWRAAGAWRRIDPYLWLVLAFSLFAAAPLAGPDYFFGAHDAPHSVFFLTQFVAALRDGVWYPGWGTDQALGYGYPTFVFYSPLAYYVAAGLHFLGAIKVAAVKGTWALATLGAGLAMYLYGRRAFGRQRGLLAAVVYVYAPYHLVDIYVRAALAEYCAFVWMPLVLLAFQRLTEGFTAQGILGSAQGILGSAQGILGSAQGILGSAQGILGSARRGPRVLGLGYARNVALAGLAYGALWMTHNVTALAFTPLLAAFVLYRLLATPLAGAEGGWTAWKRKGQAAVAALAGSLWGLGIAAALLLPNLLERGFINQEQWVRASYDYALHFVYPFQLLSPWWGYGAAGPGPVDGMSFQLGIVPTVLAMAAAASAFRRPARERAQILFWTGATVLVVFFMMPCSAALWELLPIATLVQFPWRLLALTTLTLALLAGLALPRPFSRSPRPQVLILVLAAMLASFPFTLPQYTPVPEEAEGPLLVLQFETEYPDMVGMTAWAREQPPTSPLVAQYRAGAPLVTAEALAAEASVEMIRAGGASDELWVRSPKGTEVQFYTYYFPGWRVYVDGERLPASALRPQGAYGLLVVDVPPGEHHLLLRWGDTPLRLAGKLLTLACTLAALALLVWRPRSRPGHGTPL
jgi:hypothetical protein